MANFWASKEDDKTTYRALWEDKAGVIKSKRGFLTKEAARDFAEQQARVAVSASRESRMNELPAHEANKSLREAMAEFLARAEGRKGELLPHTLRRYELDLKDFLEWCLARQVSLSRDLSRKSVFDYYSHLKDLGLAPGGQRVRFESLSAFFGMSYQRGWTVDDLRSYVGMLKMSRQELTAERDKQLATEREAASVRNAPLDRAIESGDFQRESYLRLALLRLFPGHYEVDSYWSRVLTFMLYSGSLPNTVCNLTWPMLEQQRLGFWSQQPTEKAQFVKLHTRAWKALGQRKQDGFVFDRWSGVDSMRVNFNRRNERLQLKVSLSEIADMFPVAALRAGYRVTAVGEYSSRPRYTLSRLMRKHNIKEGSLTDVAVFEYPESVGDRPALVVL